jgi:hypothetical protein
MLLTIVRQGLMPRRMTRRDSEIRIKQYSVFSFSWELHTYSTAFGDHALLEAARTPRYRNPFSLASSCASPSKQTPDRNDQSWRLSHRLRSTARNMRASLRAVPVTLSLHLSSAKSLLLHQPIFSCGRRNNSKIRSHNCNLFRYQPFALVGYRAVQ